MATVTRYVDTASSGGDGTTQGHSGATAAYASLSAWEAAEQTDLPTDTDTHVVYCAGSTADSTAVTVAGWTTGASNDILIAGDETAPDSDGWAASGILNSTHYRLEANANLFQSNENFVTLEKFQIYVLVTTARTNCIINFVDTGALNQFKKMVMRNETAGRIISSSDTSGHDVVIENCVLYDLGTACVDIVLTQGHSVFTTWTVTNCLIMGGVNGFQESGGILNCTNCAVFDNSDDFKSVGGTIDYCASDDVDGTNSVDISPGATEATEWAKAFTDYANGDFHVKDTSSVLYNAGTATGMPADDIKGVTRTTNEIGPFAFVAAAGGVGPLAHHHYHNTLRG